MQGLQVLNLSGTGVVNIEPLAQLKRLRQLDLSHTAIDTLKPLEELPELHYLNVKGTKITTEQLTALKKALPQLTVFFRKRPPD